MLTENIMQSIQEIASRRPMLRYPERGTDSRLGIMAITRGPHGAFESGPEVG
jgi:hypothetical protein